jgi:hypothetical protein
LGIGDSFNDLLVYNTTMTDSHFNNVLAASSTNLVTVYASSSAALGPHYYDAARRLGEILAAAGKAIVYGGGRTGLMGSLADAALAGNGRVFGVVPAFLVELELTHSGLSALEVVADMRVRKQRMLEHSAAVIALPGGSGTYEELFEALTLKRLGRWTGAIVVVNTGGFYDDLLRFLRRSIAERFMADEHLRMWSVVREPEEVLEAIETAHPWDSDAIRFASPTTANL